MIVVKKFDALTPHELYRILKARVDIFVVEQNCPYPECDNLDQCSDHIMLYENDELAAYARVFRKDETTYQIGRVIAVKRGSGCGAKILSAAIAQCMTYPCDSIYLEAQQYAIGFYEKAGFVVTSEPFDEDGILHVQMRKQIQREEDSK